MIDTSTHTFTANSKGLAWLVVITTLMAVIIVIFYSRIIPFLIHTNGGQDLNVKDSLSAIFLILTSLYIVLALYCDWRTYLYAKDTSLQIDMQTLTFTYCHADKTVSFKSADVAHWYWETGLFLSRVAANHSVIVLHSGETFYLHCWLFEGNKFYYSNYRKSNACYFIDSNSDILSFPEAEEAPKYKYMLPS